MSPSLPPHPVQPIHMVRGVARFRQNSIVKHLLNSGAGPFNLNDLARGEAEGRWSPGDYTQFIQLIGYSVSGYAELSTSPPEIVEAAHAEVERLLGGENKGPARRDSVVTDVCGGDVWFGPIASPGSPTAEELAVVVAERDEARAEIARLQKERVHPYAVHVISEHAAALSAENKRLREALAQAEIDLAAAKERAWDVQP